MPESSVFSVLTEISEMPESTECSEMSEISEMPEMSETPEIGGRRPGWQGRGRRAHLLRRQNISPRLLLRGKKSSPAY